MVDDNNSRSSVVAHRLSTPVISSNPTRCELPARASACLRREPEDGLLQTLRELGIALVAYSPLGRGFLSGCFRRLDDLSPDDWRRGKPPFQGEQFRKNLATAERLRQIAKEKNCTPAQLALAWLIRRHDDVIPIPGTSSLTRLEENVRAVDLQLTEHDLARIEQIVPKGVAVGESYAPEMMKVVNG